MDAVPDDLVVDILSRLPVRPLCRCKCVCRSWRDLICHPDHRRRFAQTISRSGFFYPSLTGAWRFASACDDDAPGAKPPGDDVFDPACNSFLPSSYSRADMELMDSCDGLLLLRCRRTSEAPPTTTYSYVVCNPATAEWDELPAPDSRAPGTARLAALAFDPAVSPSGFHVLQLVEQDLERFGVHVREQAAEIYSSETRRWVLSDTTTSVGRRATGQAAYHGGSVHLATDNACVVMSVDAAQGKSWSFTRITGSYGGVGFLGRSRGRLLYAYVVPDSPSVWIYALDKDGRRTGGKEAWLPVHCCATDRFGGEEMVQQQCFRIVAFHPDRNVIFLFDTRRRVVVAYDMDRRTVREVRPLPQMSPLPQALPGYSFFPYVPMYSSEALLSG